jgi:translation initiation factor 5A
MNNMALKIINGTEVRVGSTIIIDDEPCIVKKFDVSKTGKHGHAKVRIEAVGISDGKKRVIARPGHERFEVPMIIKKKAQILSDEGSKYNVMDIESFENFELNKNEDIEEELNEGDQVEYWDIEGQKIIRRKL